METSLQVSALSDVPVYRQIVRQLTYMIDAGELSLGDRLPSSRLLAANLHINRNTVAHAYTQLRDAGLVEARGRGGMVVTGRRAITGDPVALEMARKVLGDAIAECAALGVPGADIVDIVTAIAGPAVTPRIVFVECNAERATYFATELERHLGLTVTPLVFGEFELSDERADLVLTTFFHLAQTRTQFKALRADVVAIVVAPHIQTLVQIARIPHEKTIGIWYSTDDQAASIRDSLTQAGITHIRLLRDASDAELDGIHLVVIPTEAPHMREALDGRIAYLEFGNSLDAASLRMVREVVREVVRDAAAAHS